MNEWIWMCVVQPAGADTVDVYRVVAANESIARAIVDQWIAEGRLDTDGPDGQRTPPGRVHVCPVQPLPPATWADRHQDPEPVDPAEVAALRARIRELELENSALRHPEEWGAYR